MSNRRPGVEPRPLLPATVEDRLLGLLMKVLGVGLAILAAVGWLSLVSWSAADPSLTHATSGQTRNLLGPIGAIFSDLVLQTVGFAAIVVFLGPAYAGIEMMLNERLPRPKSRALYFVLAVAILAGALSSLPSPESWPLNNGLGGAAGDLVFKLVAGIISIILPGRSSGLAGLLLFGGGMAVLSAALGLGQRDWVYLTLSTRHRRLRASAQPDGSIGREAAGMQIRPAEASHPFSDPADSDRFEPTFAGEPRNDASSASVPHHATRPGPSPAARPQVRSSHTRPAATDAIQSDQDPDSHFDKATDLASRSIAERFAPGRGGEKPAPLRKPSEIIGGLLAFRSNPSEYRRPSLNILKRPPASRPGAEHTQPVLRGNARLLEDVLNDFGIKGEVKGIRPGPVVTLFEIEPARGIKASRIIALGEDIARSMSAVSARVAPVPGRNVIGIELPNVRRDTVYLRELLEHEAWRTSEAQLPVVLGRSIGGDPVIADLARMPHLLVAGTTGSGKSVGVNALILSLLYRQSPADCRFLMIDPKMLELSVYNGIPHLLAPVVTDPHKAAAALGWAVSEMEERYKRMAQLGVRNIEMFNVRIRNARKRGELLGRTVQTGFDDRTGEPIYVREDAAAEPMPFIVIVVDEFADLMAVAGKEVEGVVQRLAQMARAAGIHLVMATQRPSVDVVTGTIKANFPSRIAFKVASKIDSRTIINDIGAEQLLGAGDMLYAPGSGQMLRVHGPFVSDDEVERVASALREQGSPDYVQALAQQLEASAVTDDGTATPSPADSADDLFDRAVAIVHRDGKASTSYLQRRLGLGYNRAADLIDRMQQEGIISPADNVGRRRVLIGEPTPGE